MAHGNLCLLGKDINGADNEWRHDGTLEEWPAEELELERPKKHPDFFQLATCFVGNNFLQYIFYQFYPALVDPPNSRKGCVVRRCQPIEIVNGMFTYIHRVSFKQNALKVGKHLPVGGLLPPSFSHVYRWDIFPKRCEKIHPWQPLRLHV